MNDPFRDDQRSRRTDRRRWLRLAVIAAVIVVLLVAVALVLGGPGGHGPSRH